MKMIKYMVSLLAFGALTGCSEDIEPVGPNGNETADNGYINVAINLPTQSGSSLRADDGLANDDFEDGTADEYAVKKVYLVLFSGDTEASATFQSAYDLGMTFNNEDKFGDNPNITSRKSTIFKVNEAAGDHYFALAIVNPNENIRLEDGVLYVNNREIDHTNYHNISVEGAVESDFRKEGNGFLMLNAPLAKYAGNDASNPTQQVSTLVPLSVSSSEEQAKAHRADIYVERALAKVTVSYSSSLSMTDGKINISGKNSAFTDDQAEMEGWYLNVTNKSTKLVRDVSDWETWAGSDYKNSTIGGNRFFGNANPYRVYWAIDDNYDKAEVPTKEFHIYTKENAEDLKLTNVSTNTETFAAYCFENTCNTTAMATDKQVTSVIFKMKYYHHPNKADGETFYMIGDNEAIYDASGLITAINTSMSSNAITGLAVKAEAKGGFYNTKEEIKNLFTTSNNTALTDEQATQILTSVSQIKVYENGVSYYYAANIKHFGDYYTPIDNDKTGNTVTYTEAKYLGRYGVVRNNWYEIVIASVSGPGSPEMPDPETPDTEKYFVNVQVNILAWAKRKQEVNL